MIVIDGYTLIQYPNENRIVITLPQTLNTMIDTATPVANRRKVITGGEEAALLEIIKHIYEYEPKDEVEE